MCGGHGPQRCTIDDEASAARGVLSRPPEPAASARRDANEANLAEALQSFRHPLLLPTASGDPPGFG